MPARCSIHPFAPAAPTDPRARPAAALALLAGLTVSAVFVFAPLTASAEENFAFVNVGPQLMARIDTSTGQVASSKRSGDGGWRNFGGAAPAGDAPARPGRYGLLSLATRSGLFRGPRNETSVEVMRVDHDTGLAWVGDLAGPVAWHEVGGGIIDAAPVQEMPSEPATADSPSADITAKPELPLIPMEELQRAMESGGDETDPVDVFVLALEQPAATSELRVWAAAQLGEVESARSVPVLLELLTDEDPAVVAAAVRSLGKSGDASVVPELLKLRDHPDARVREAVAGTVK